MSIEKLLEEYTEDYCQCLELSYGEGMMSEGGTLAIDAIFDGIDLTNKNCLEIGSGLGGTAYYLAREHQAYVTGLEINQRMTEQSTRNIPSDLALQLKFVANQGTRMPFDSESFDVVYSKGVLTHVEDKMPIFDEVYRVLKPGGLFVINDWLSASERWGPIMQRFCDVDDLTVFPATIESYKSFLDSAGFDVLKYASEDEAYIRYNIDIVERLKTEPIRSQFIVGFGEKEYGSHVEAFSLTAKAIQDGELKVYRFQCQK